jgi:hypothetical protein
MIEDLKADSARWDQERRQQTARSPVGGTIASRDSAGPFIQKSNSLIVQYRNSDTHQSRQYYGPTEGATGNYPPDNRDAYDATPRYPGTGTAGYTGASGTYPAQPYGGNQGGYPGQPGYTTAQPQQFSQPTADVSYQGGASMAGAGFGQASAERPYTQMGANMAVRDTAMYGTNDPYAATQRDQRIPVTTMAQGRPTYVTSGAPVQQGFPAVSPSGGSGYYQQQSQSGSSQFVPTDSRDPFYGRGMYTRA